MICCLMLCLLYDSNVNSLYHVMGCFFSHFKNTPCPLPLRTICPRIMLIVNNSWHCALYHEAYRGARSVIPCVHKRDSRQSASPPKRQNCVQYEKDMTFLFLLIQMTETVYNIHRFTVLQLYYDSMYCIYTCKLICKMLSHKRFVNWETIVFCQN